ncbi:MAG: hypothetical protein COX81_00855 [Candidatus Magasanikbacteria bacterium CG_4_10_14_0_2_um_filter_37_12]|uniref:Clp R domain-containing protein n=1 Tax=Candidatus Magasanikbacteria bacterium CG_4_10_14_0_2_um_filter_37_12 TaxID=1974637 RepID=A0A2M7V9C9_9BACT|nr:MAG: hypothetical protein COX81_00855 [Candidatus Magasanikbacteria bacterium CG_4_10_14_0_2_um_filter_37_12]
MDTEHLLDKLTTHLKNVIAKSISSAAENNHPDVIPLHIFLALKEEKGSIATQILENHNIKTEDILSLLSSLTIRSNDLKKQLGQTITLTLPSLNTTSKNALEKAMLLAYEHGNGYVGTEHLLYGLIKTNDFYIQKILREAKIKIAELEDQIAVVVQNINRFPSIDEVAEAMDQLHEDIEPHMPPLTQQNQSTKPKQKNHSHKQPTALETFTTELTGKEIQSRLDPVVGRKKEIERLINILGRRNKNNPVLVGEPGVGKTAIVEGLAKKIHKGQVPDILKNKKILSLDMALLIAGTIYRGEFEGRLKQIIEEVQMNPNIILFIDEIHNIIGTGSNQGTMDAANILKPALARGQLHCIGATTIDEYKKHISSDPALERRFQSIDIEEPSRDEVLEILEGIKTQYEQFHHVQISPKTIECAVDLSIKYIHDNFLPDKAIDLLDEASASVKNKQKMHPTQKKIEKIKKELEKSIECKEQAIYAEEFSAAMDLKKQTEVLQKQIASLEKKIANTKSIPKKPITPDNIAEVLGKKLNIDPKVLTTDTWKQLEILNKKIKQQIFGQDQTIEQIIQSLRQSHLGLKSPKKPFASFLFVGPSGVGKTKLAKTLATEMYYDEKALIKLDMSEFAEQHGISKLLGSPAGYIGHKERNHFTDQIKRRPYSVVLFDEIDKAHPDVVRLLLQILDEGELTDSTGKKINFSHATIILTSNIGAELYKSHGIGFGHSKDKETAEVKKEIKSAINSRLKEQFGAELLGRLDQICFFSTLSQETLRQIIQNRIESINEQLTKNDIQISSEESTVNNIIKNSYNEDTGARIIESALEKIISEAVAKLLLKKTTKTTYTLKRVAEEYKLV